MDSGGATRATAPTRGMNTRARQAAAARPRTLSAASPEAPAMTLAARTEPVRPVVGARSRARGDETRARIIAEAARCVLEEGFAAASANHIAHRSGVTWGVIQYHFGDRAGLFSAVVQAGYEEFCLVLDSATIPDGPVRAQVEAVVDVGWQAFSSPLGRASMEILVNTRSARASDPDHATRLVDMARGLHRLLDRRLPAMTGADGAALRTVVWAALRGFVLTLMMSPSDYDFRAERRVLVDLVVNQIELHRPAEDR